MLYLGDVSARQRVVRCVESDMGTANYSYVLPAQLGDVSRPAVRLERISNASRKIILVEMNGVTARFDGLVGGRNRDLRLWARPRRIRTVNPEGWCRRTATPR